MNKKFKLKKFDIDHLTEETSHYFFQSESLQWSKLFNTKLWYEKWKQMVHEWVDLHGDKE